MCDNVVIYAVLSMYVCEHTQHICVHHNNNTYLSNVGFCYSVFSLASPLYPVLFLPHSHCRPCGREADINAMISEGKAAAAAATAAPIKKLFVYCEALSTRFELCLYRFARCLSPFKVHTKKSRADLLVRRVLYITLLFSQVTRAQKKYMA